MDVQDVDLVVLNSVYGQETLKEMLVTADPDFYLVLPRRGIAAGYKVLWYQKGRGSNAYTQYTRSSLFQARCKVDILVPGIMNIPTVPAERVRTLSALPTMPILPHLFLKLQAWADHRASHRSDQIAKQYVDVDDIKRLLEIAVARRARVHASESAWVPQSMVQAAKTRVQSFVSIASPSSKNQWRAIGIAVEA